ncbi:homoserine dehydrogenase family protein [Nonlabens antarcticus]|uniref:aspartate kinase n=1 Tax=Nonlabens antarcticus TaxID=392714 RepID=UPI001890D1CC|nr:aspartate kinase [Nonlabens antarcticus]
MTQIHIYLFGIGNVGKTFIQQILESSNFFKQHHHLDLRIVGLANSRSVLTVKDGIGTDWKEVFGKESSPREADSFYRFSKNTEVLKIAVDATASQELSRFYPEIVQHGFSIVTANKIANTLSQDFYDRLRSLLKEQHLNFEYETNVGAGLPIVETVRSLYNSGEQIFVINGVFSGSLGYIFNRFSEEDVSFSQVVTDALDLGFTEPDPREDLSGNDVARKLLVLAREAGLKLEFEDISIESLVTPTLKSASLHQFLTDLSQLDSDFQDRKDALKEDEVLRHLGQLDVINKQLKVSLQVVKKSSPAGQLQGSDGFFEIYSESYAQHPLVIKGAGAGREVTARGLVSDIVKICKSQPVYSLELLEKDF